MSPPTLAGPVARDSDTSEICIYPRPEIESLLASARRGDRQSIGELLAHCRAYLTLLGSTHFQRRLRPRVSQSDIVQEAMLRAHAHFAQFRGHTERELMAWLREILVNSLARFVEQHVRTAKRDIRREISLDQIPGAMGALAQSPSAESYFAPHTSIPPDERPTLLAALLSQLPEHYREVLVLRNIQGLSFEEVAERLHRSPGATRMLWLRAIEKLRAVYRKAEQYD
ncbi:RNA polymerase sigma factor SigM [Anatilimnocola aggregata]|uniref:RNA polymerase sigma factor SigM n=1 Tax=Anatilimnocola aggregata TaxID=2528021 RepID=A0A517YA20_9BACT|nr:sigma-70 family RNA polymerase sigma factor [Anatilimnocola aggregata]QDU27093.1 RNA polymerase sigma factor SigM [Anatilimnocola aggregata]